MRYEEVGRAVAMGTTMCWSSGRGTRAVSAYVVLRALGSVRRGRMRLPRAVQVTPDAGTGQLGPASQVSGRPARSTGGPGSRILSRIQHFAADRAGDAVDIGLRDHSGGNAIRRILAHLLQRLAHPRRTHHVDPHAVGDI